MCNHKATKAPNMKLEARNSWEQIPYPVHSQSELLVDLSVLLHVGLRNGVVLVLAAGPLLLQLQSE